MWVHPGDIVITPYKKILVLESTEMMPGTGGEWRSRDKIRVFLFYNEYETRHNCEDYYFLFVVANDKIIRDGEPLEL